MFLLLFVTAVAAQTLEKPYQLYAEVGSEITIPYCRFTQCPGDVIWYMEMINSPPIFNFTISGVFTGQRLCEYTAGSIKTWNYLSLQYNCNHKNLNLFNLQITDSAVYNVKNIEQYVEYNTYYKLNVIYIPEPKCAVTTSYLGRQATGDEYCLIEINCTNSKHPNTVIFNNRSGNYFVKERGGKGPLPNYYETFFDIYGITKSFTFTYPFDTLCQEINSVDSLTALTDFTPIFISIIVIAVIVIIISIGLFCFYRQKNKSKAKENTKVNIQLL